jgi:putative transposase
MKKHTNPLEPERFYHVYNRGINGENIFKEERNYAFFLAKYAYHLHPFVETYAYCLLKNHFHLLIHTRSEEEIRKHLSTNVVVPNVVVPQRDDDIRDNDNKSKYHNKSISWILSNAFANFFKSYALSINKSHDRTGSLFEESFRRILVSSEDYFTELIYYIHHNPRKHGFVKDFRDYPHSSYHSHLHTAFTKLKRDEVMAWFGNKTEFEKFHLENQILNDLDKFDIEFD